MVIKVYVSRVSGSLDIRKKQEFIRSVLQGKKISFEEVDISDAANESEKLFMREHGEPSANEKNVLPPQIFNNSVYCGGYEAFHEANEDNELKKFLNSIKSLKIAILFSVNLLRTFKGFLIVN
ncbi:hypothetical protein HELRODRAFT_159163 [Helobdella robusta]|uniref:SH3 domain-binding glutamic acid-rich-like protein n=1 Tax=Helobdella robusta TaxID=6412 RepID=T1ENP3_HELRO|nr:hypothetical protein HELRODRAFT_159163 [Helobdella robusta]ESO12601.1 hypothetical protein HELRODRAFT_159163 [Helobdella robusta]